MTFYKGYGTGTRASLNARLAAMVRKHKTVTSKYVDSPCWEYFGWRDDYGYGRFSVPRKGDTTGKKRTHIYVHRLVWELNYGPIPEGFEPDHLCFFRSCCRPSHLELVTHEENIRRRDVRQKELRDNG